MTTTVVVGARVDDVDTRATLSLRTTHAGTLTTLQGSRGGVA